MALIQPVEKNMKTRLLPMTFTTALSICTSIAAEGDWVEWPVSAGGNGHFYLPVSVPNLITWQDCKAAAESAGGYLVTITSAAENTFVYNLIEAPHYWSYGGQLGPGLGGYQPPSSIEPAGGWTWVSGESWTYSNWVGSQPDNGDSPSEDMVHFLRGGVWNDKLSTRAFLAGYVVERSTCTPHKAKATAQLVNGFVVDAALTDSGCGYTNAPVVLIQGGGGSGATARAVITDGRVTGIIITDAGIGYETLPRIVIASPPFVPTVSISVSKVKVVQNVVLGRNYVLEASRDAALWSQALPPFTAVSESITNEFDTDLTGRYFRVRETP
jgi:hypothetical protein